MLCCLVSNFSRLILLARFTDRAIYLEGVSSAVEGGADVLHVGLLYLENVDQPEVAKVGLIRYILFSFGYSSQRKNILINTVTGGYKYWNAQLTLDLNKYYKQ